MALKEYRFQDRTFLFDEDDAPEGAELIGDVKESVAPGTFEELVMAGHDKRRKRAARKAKQADPEESSEEGSEESSEESAENTGDAAE